MGGKREQFEGPTDGMFDEIAKLVEIKTVKEAELVEKGAKIRSWRESIPLTREELAVVTGLKTQTIVRAEKGKATISVIDGLLELAQRSNVISEETVDESEGAVT